MKLAAAVGLALFASVPSRRSYKPIKESVSTFIHNEKTFLNTKMKGKRKNNKYFIYSYNHPERGETEQRIDVTTHVGDMLNMKGYSTYFAFRSNRAPAIYRVPYSNGIRQLWIFPNYIHDQRPLARLEEERSPVLETVSRSQYLGFARYTREAFKCADGMQVSFHYLGFAGMWVPILVSQEQSYMTE